MDEQKHRLQRSPISSVPDENDCNAESDDSTVDVEHNTSHSSGSSRSSHSSSSGSKLYPNLKEEVRKIEHLNISPECARTSPRNKRKVKSSNGGSSDEGYGVFMLLCLMIVAVLAFILQYVWPSQTDVKLISAHAVVKDLKSDFRRQNDLSFRVIHSALERLIREDAASKKPAVISLISSRSAKDVSECFAKKLASLVYSNNYTLIDGRNYRNMEPDAAKKKIDDLLLRSFNNEKLSVCLVHHFDLIPAHAAMIFHGYCDDSNASFKRAIYIMTVTSNDEILPGADFRQMDSTLSNRLTEVWHDLHIDQLNSLLSRITVSVAALLPDKLPAYCHM